MQIPSTKQTAVRNLQRYLRRLSDENGQIPPVPVDGIFGSRTEEALSAFQRLWGLPVNGRADRTTWELLFAEFNRLRVLDQRDFLEPFPQTPKNYRSTIGETGPFISLLQFVLEELRVIYDSLPPLSPTGIYDENTADVVREFQRIHGLEQSGRVDRLTWNHLTRAYNRYATG